MQPLERPGFPVRLALIFVILSAGIAVFGFLYYREQKRTIQRERNEELGAIADLKASQIESWRRERLADGTYIQENPLVLQAMERLLSSPPSPQLEGTVLLWMSDYKHRHGYSNLILVDTQRRARLSTITETRPIEPENLSLVTRALQSRTVILSDLQLNADGAIEMFLCVPVSSPVQSAPLGALLLEIDPRQSLYPLIESWPMPGKTAETFLLRREANDILYLNELRHRAGTALSLRLPVDRTVLYVVKPGPGAIGEAYDYRGTAVVAAARAISDSPWILIAKMDREEIYGPLRQRALSTALLGFLLFVAAASAILLLWREQQAGFYRRQHASEVEQQVLAERLDVLSHHANDIILVADPLGTILDANERATLSLGYERRDFLRLTMPDLLPPETRPHFERQWARLMEESALVFETVHQRKDSSTFPVEISARVIAFQGNMCCQSIIRDISERKKVEEQLRLLESATLQTSDGVLILRVSGERECCQDPVFVNPAFEHMTGYNLEELRQGAVRNFFQSAINPHSIQDRAEGFRGRCPTHLEQLAVRKDGSKFWAEWKFGPLAGRDGAFTHCVWICRDIKDRKLAEEEIHRLNRQLEQRVLDRTAQLQEANQELEAFAYSVSHDLRAPLRAVDGFSRILLEEYGPQLPKEAQYYLQVARRNAVQMGELIDGLLKFSRLSRQPLCKQPVAPAGLVRQAWEELHLEREGREVEIRVGDLAPCEGDALLLKQVFLNLLSNALKYTRTRDVTRIEIGCQRIGIETSYFVRDNGIGFDVRYRDKLFEVFQRLHRAEEYEGTGVGLATVQRIVHRHGGQVWADSVLNQGATFYFTLDSGPNHSQPAFSDSHQSAAETRPV